jgi:type I restriction enzyme S subunit
MSEHRPIGSFSNQVKRLNEAFISRADVYSVTKYDGFVRSLDYFKKQVFSRDLSSYKIVKRGEFAYSTIHLDEGALGLLGDEEALISPMYTTFEVDESVDKIYLSYLLRSPELVSQYGLIGQGSVNRRKSVPFSSLAEIEVFTPLLPEQKKIAEILSGVDKTLKAIGNKIRKIEEILKGTSKNKRFPVLLRT